MSSKKLFPVRILSVLGALGLVLSLLLGLLSSCDLELLPADESVNDYIYPYLEFSPNEDGESYNATVVEGAKLEQVYIPAEIEVEDNTYPVTIFTGFKNQEDAAELRILTTEAEITIIEDAALENATNLELIEVKKTSQSVQETKKWGALPTMEKAGLEFDGWYIKDTEVKVKEGDTMIPNFTTIEPRWKAHDLKYFAQVDASCTTNGALAHYKCQSCLKIYSDESALNEVTEASLVIPATHNLKYVEARAANCTQAGNIAHYKCETCDLCFSDEEAKNYLSTQDVIISALGHTATYVQAKASTCTEEGYLAHYKCERCNELFTDQACQNQTTEGALITAELGHVWEYRYSTGTGTGSGTGTGTGSTIQGHWQECTRCHETKDYDSPLEHELEYHQKVEATCTTAGTEAYYQCKDCHAYFRDSQGLNKLDEPQTIAANGHTYGSTYYIEGNYHYKKCTKCEAEGTRETHKYEEITEGRSPLASQTCTSGAVYKKSCECGQESEQTFVYKTGFGHSKATMHAEEKSNCTTQGHKVYYTCSKECCKGKFYEDAALEKEVSWEDLKLPLASHVCTTKYKKDATSHTSICDICNQEVSKQTHTKTYLHDYYVHHLKCETCGYESADENHTLTGTEGSRICKTCGYSETESQNLDNSFSVHTVDKNPHGDLTAEQKGTTWTFTLTSTNRNAQPDTYVWFLDGEIVSGQDTNIYVLEAPGKHTYRVMCVFSSEGRYSSESMTITGGT